MSLTATQMTSSSISYARYEVFLSFRGKDTRTNFTSHLYKALKQAGILTFRDDDEVLRGEQVANELEKAIKESRASIIVFSKNHASSKWCLDELVMILERKRNEGHKVLPVFYGVQPSQLKEQKGNFELALAKHECDGVVPKKIAEWRAALREVAGLAGKVLKDNQDEVEFIDDIVRDIEDKLNLKKYLRVPPFIVGIGYHIQSINSWLHDQSIVENVLLLYGIGGVGKTTIAKAIYNENFKNFEASSFVANIGRVQNELGGLICLQEQILEHITRKKHKIVLIDQGVTAIQKAISRRRVLIVLDDIAMKEHLDALFAMENSLCAGSKMIITSRNKHIAKPMKYVWMKEVRPLSLKDSSKLFRWHAFKLEKIDESYHKYAKSVVDYCEGLPLAIEVFGSYLSGTTHDVWRSALEDLKAADEENRIGKILRLSYDSLPGQCEKDMFLDIVCFLVGSKVDYASKVLESFGREAIRCRLQKLEDRCLISIDKNKRLRVHQLLQEMGKEVVYQKSPDEPWSRSRLWGIDAYEVVKLRKGMETIEGMALRFPIEDKHLRKTINLGSGSKQDNCQVVLEAAAFTKMSRLKFLVLVNTKLEGEYKNFPQTLKWLKWHGLTEEYLPKDLNLENLVGLDMSNSSLKQAWKGNKVMKNLKVLKLKDCTGLIKTPNFLGLPSLEIINLRSCINLVEVHESIGDLKSLAYLNLKNCKSLENLPGSMGKMKSLEILILSGCEKLGHHQMKIGKMGSADVHDDVEYGAGMKQSSLTAAKSWLLWLWNCQRQLSLPSFTLNTLPQSLVKLHCRNCNISDDKFPRDLTSFISLRELNLNGNPIRSLPESIINLTKLKKLEVSRCYGLQSLPPLPPNLELLVMQECHLLKKITCLPNKNFRFGVCKSYRSKAVKLERCCNLGLFKYCEFLNLESSGVSSLHRNRVRYYPIVRSQTEGNVNWEVIIQPLQIVHASKMSFIFLPGKEVLDYYPEAFDCSWQGRECSWKPWDCYLKVPVPLLLDRSIWGWSICITHLQRYPIDHDYVTLTRGIHVGIENSTKGLLWMLQPSLFGIGIKNEEGSEMSWVSVYHCETFLSVGDRLKVFAHLGPAFEFAILEFDSYTGGKGRGQTTA